MEEAANELLSILETNGFAAYKVGGYVRDKLLGLPINDIDVATSATPDQVMSVFPKVIPTGIKHGTVTVVWREQHLEVTTFRRELNYVNHRHPGEVEFVQDISMDLGRRDYTINAMAMDKRGRLIDPYEGQKDLSQGILRAVGNPLERFEEDALRILRGLRFSVRFGLHIEKTTWAAMMECSHLLTWISRERIRDEIVKMIEGTHPASAIDLLATKGLLPFKDWSTRLDSLTSHDGGVWLEECTNPTLRWAALCYHDPVDEVQQFFSHWRFPNKQYQAVATYLRIAHTPLAGEREAKKLLLLYGMEKVREGRMLSYVFSPSMESVPFEHLEKWNEQLNLRHIKQLAVTGEELVLVFQKRPGPWIKESLQYLFERVAIDGIPNDREYLLQEIRKVKDQR
ncbi:CCA tRNA nucleotidyltransferase [Ammoniphilus sp. CFH 90114]|uniref:CCA tRNA nucleotidyltransferase n=1 Tax=Ammoniphilus sp. CFH 90114 TaxID=2493665 RepID=UPI00100ED345|nr:CCA tRNA nucleotidyltransferase [Ammoniphilus sp. CFH 90114]RXT13942.1 CCA tRNA nucleotidyltransferase [Ammoniphilus sp. CFH 90114]